MCLDKQINIDVNKNIANSRKKLIDSIIYAEKNFLYILRVKKDRE